MDIVDLSGGLAALSCEDCGLDPAALWVLSRHVDHVAAELDADDQRLLRAHLFALLATIRPVAAGRNE